MSVRIKICGITNVSDALAAVEAGADALGFMFYPPSPRAVTVDHAAAIIRELPPFVARVGVFVDPAEGEVRRALVDAGIDTLQFHGSESPAFCRSFGPPDGPVTGRRVVKAFRVKDESSLAPLEDYNSEAWLLDAFVAGQLGGTGARFNWELARVAIARGGPRRVILAGGLTAENAAQAVREVAPYGLDVSSGVESAPGRKDAEKMRRFIAEARRTSP